APRLQPSEIEAGKITVAIFDANTFRRNELIGERAARRPVLRCPAARPRAPSRAERRATGQFEFDVQGVYYRQHHELFRQWVALTDITDEHEGIQGYLKLSLVVLGPGDEQHVHTAAEEDDESDGGPGAARSTRREGRG